MTRSLGVIQSQTVVVRGLRLQARIGVHDHERTTVQPLVLDVDVSLSPDPVQDSGSTFDYENVVRAAREIVGEGHIELVETVARRLAEACLGHAAARRVRVYVSKPKALSPDAELAGVEMILEKPEP